MMNGRWLTTRCNDYRCAQTGNCIYHRPECLIDLVKVTCDGCSQQRHPAEMIVIKHFGKCCAYCVEKLYAQRA